MATVHPGDEAFVKTFIEYAEKHNSCLKEQDYSKRYRLNKALLTMLEELKQYDDAESIIKQILEAQSECATLWISNFAIFNNIYKDVVEAKLHEIATKKPSGNVMAWVLLKAKQKKS